MANQDFKTKGQSPTDITEDQSGDVLRSKLPRKEALFQWYEDKNPNLDGHIEFMKDDGGSTSFKLFFQLKGTNQAGVAYYDYETEYLNYFYQSPEPTALILVNIPDGKVYWRLINQAYIVSGLGIENLAEFDQKTKRVLFSDDTIIDNNAAELLEACKKHYADASQAGQYAQDAKAKMQLVTGQEEALRILVSDLVSVKEAGANELQQKKEVEKQPSQKTFADLEKSFVERTRDLPEKMMLYHAFVYALRPFYLDYRGDEKRGKLLKFLKITEAEERYIIESLMSAGLIGRVGDLIFVANKEEATLSLDHFFETGVVDPEQVAKLFSNEENR